MDSPEIVPYKELLPTESWSDSVKCFWSAGRAFTEQQPFFEILPDSYAELIFSFGPPCSVEVEGGVAGLQNPFLIGLLNAPLKLLANGRLTVCGVRLYPWALAGVAAAFQSREFDGWLPVLSKCFAEVGATQTLEKMREKFESRVPLISDAILKKAGELFLSRKGEVAPADLAAHANASLRTLQRTFQRNCGETAKSVSRRMRFERVRDHLWRDPEAHLTRIAYEYGFADQAHFNHEFQHFSHRTPGQFAREARISKAFLEANSVVYLQSGGE